MGQQGHSQTIQSIIQLPKIATRSFSNPKQFNSSVNGAVTI